MPAWTGQASVRDGWPLHVLENAAHFMVAEPPEAFSGGAAGRARQPLTTGPTRAACIANRQERPMLHLISQDIKAIARRTLREIFPRDDVAALAEVLHPNIVDHDGPPGAPQGLDGMTWSIRVLQAAFSDRRWEIHQVIAEDDTVVLSCTFHSRHTGQFMGLAPTSRSVEAVAVIATPQPLA
jgi:predicted ester cyclase